MEETLIDYQSAEIYQRELCVLKNIDLKV
ncbi:hypothetical protein EZS27_038534, partial [termite gut metagenome]